MELHAYRCCSIDATAWRRKKLLLLDNMRKEKKSIIPVECRGGGYFTSRLNSLGRVLFPCQIISISFYFIFESLNWIFMLLIFDWNIEWECFCELISTSLNKVNLSNFKAFSRFKFLSMLISSGYLCTHGTIYQHQWWRSNSLCWNLSDRDKGVRAEIVKTNGLIVICRDVMCWFFIIND